jgi:hypothetical protein
MRGVGAAAKFGNRTSRIFFLQGEQGFTSSLALILPHRVWDYPLRPRPAAYPVLNTALEPMRSRVHDSALSSIYGSLCYSMVTQYVARAALAFRAPC